MLIYLESCKASLTFSIDPQCTYSNTQNLGINTSMFIIILVLLNTHQQGRYLCADGIMNSLHINEHLAMLK